jgi:glutathione peroxidase
MKYYLFILLFYSGGLTAQNSIYDMTVQSATGKTIPLSNYKGKKLLIAVVNPGSLQKKDVINYWDSLQLRNPNTVVIIIPANDISAGEDVSISSAQPISDKVIVVSSAPAKKDKGNNQHPLIKWLTHGDKNNHFDADVETDNQLYVISQSGVLYAVLGKTVRKETIDAVLKQADIKR